MKTYAIILAAGKGTRMKSLAEDKSKVSYPILGVPLVKHVLNALRPLSIDRKVTIVGFGGPVTEEIVKSESETVYQHEQKGTGHAIMQAAP
ncbi:MAG: NTP transferase domain-containing protein, partial [Bacilli bacterium]|nr:NTP transferase domain-containing protein [Bacilli bacterium]